MVMALIAMLRSRLSEDCALNATEKNDCDAVAFLVTEYCQLADVGNVLHTTVFASVTVNEFGTRHVHVFPQARDANQNDNEY